MLTKIFFIVLFMKHDGASSKDLLKNACVRPAVTRCKVTLEAEQFIERTVQMTGSLASFARNFLRSKYLNCSNVSLNYCTNSLQYPFVLRCVMLNSVSQETFHSR